MIRFLRHEGFRAEKQALNRTKVLVALEHEKGIRHGT
jgi:hypothetical protein